MSMLIPNATSRPLKRERSDAELDVQQQVKKPFIKYGPARVPERRTFETFDKEMNQDEDFDIGLWCHYDKKALELANDIYPAIIKPVLIRRRAHTEDKPFHHLPPFDKPRYTTPDVHMQNELVFDTHEKYLIEISDGECQAKTPEERVKVIRDVRKQLCQMLQDKGESTEHMHRCTIDISKPNKLENQVITIVWPLRYEYTRPSRRDLKVNVKGKEFPIRDHQRDADNTDWTVSVCMGASKSPHRFIDLLARVLDRRARIDQVWRLDILDAGHNHGQWTGILRILISYFHEYNEWKSKGIEEYRHFHQVMPGYINFDGEEIKLEYLYRLPWCEHCKSNAESSHTYEYCPFRKCLECKKIKYKVQVYGDQECDADSDFDADDVADDSV